MVRSEARISEGGSTILEGASGAGEVTLSEPNAGKHPIGRFGDRICGEDAPGALGCF